MATIRELTEGMKILAKYLPKGEDTIFGGAEHDVVFVCPFFEAEITPEDETKLEELQFRRSRQYDCWIHNV